MIENLKFISTQSFDDVPCDFYKNVNDEYLVTREQIGTALGYKNPANAIKNIHLKHKERLDKFSTWLTLGQKEGNRIVSRKMIVYNVKGVMSIINYSDISENRKLELIKTINKITETQMVVLSSPKEIEFLDKLEPFLKVFNIAGTRQYKVLDYRIDFYIPSLNIAIEYDENNHKYYTYEQQELRQELIENALHCRFIRLSDKDTDEVNLAKVIKEIYNFD